MLMTERWDFAPACAAEFPNDNPALHFGATWACLGVTGPLRPIVRARPRPTAHEVVPEVGAQRQEEAGAAEPPAAVLAPEVAMDGHAGTAALESNVEESPANDVNVPASEGTAIEELTREPVSECAAPSAEASGKEDSDRSPIGELANEPAPEGAAPGEHLSIEACDAVGPTSESTRVATESASDCAMRSEDPRIEASGAVPMASAGDAVSGEASEVIAPASESPQLLMGPASEPGASMASTPIERSDAAASAPEPTQAATTELVLDPEACVPVLVSASAEEAVRFPDPPDSYDAFVQALTAVAMATGASRAAALVATVLDGSADLRGFPEEIRASLVRAGVVEASGSRVSEAFVATADAWRRVLRNESSDFSACGTATLDVWGADLLRSLGTDGGIDVRKELRRRGVAAFGMRVAA